MIERRRKFIDSKKYFIKILNENYKIKDNFILQTRFQQSENICILSVLSVILVLNSYSLYYMCYVIRNALSTVQRPFCDVQRRL